MPIGSMRDTNAQPERNKEVRERVPAASQTPAKVPIQWELSAPKYKIDDIILKKETLAKLEDALSYYENRDLLFNEWGLKERYSERENLSINLYGQPGTGKTMAAHAIADKLSLRMICVDYAEIESKYVGETSKNLSSLFQKAIAENAMIFFDEADALLSKRVTNMTSATDVSVNQTRSVLLNLLNNYQGVIVFATNFIQNFDPAFLRRIKYHIQFDLPDTEGRARLWQMYIPHQLPTDLDIAALSEKYNGISGSDISNAVFAAAVRAARNHAQMVPTAYFEEAIQSAIDVKRANTGNVTVKTRQISEEELRNKLNLEGI